MMSGHSVYTSLSAPRDVRVGWDGMEEVIEANILATRGTADTCRLTSHEGLEHRKCIRVRRCKH